MNEKPKWCPHEECKFIVCWQNKMCGGKLPEPMEHDGDFNTHRFCLKDTLPNNEIFDLQINKTDVYWFKKLFDFIDNNMG